jgi:hypothetical protein
MESCVSLWFAQMYEADLPFVSLASVGRMSAATSAISLSPHIALMSFVKWFEHEMSSPCDFRWSAWQ